MHQKYLYNPVLLLITLVNKMLESIDVVTLLYRHNSTLMSQFTFFMTVVVELSAVIQNVQMEVPRSCCTVQLGRV